MAGIPFLHNIDLNNHQLLNAKLHTSDSAPSTPGIGTIWYDSNNDLVKLYDNTATGNVSGWNTITGDITGVSITAGAGLSGTVATTAGAHTQTLLIDLSGYSDVTPTHGDKLFTIDSDGSTEQLTTVAALAALFAGSGLTATNSVIAVDTLNQDTTGTAAIATTVTITDNENTNEDNAIVFTSGGDVDGGNIGLESDGDLIYNPSTGRLTATQLAGTVQTATQAIIDHDSLANYAANEHFTQASIVTTGAINSGSITSGFGNIDNGSSTFNTGAATVDSLSVSDGNITNVGDIALDSISADGTDINIAISDNSATALTIKQGSDAYLIVDTANSSESVSIGTGISGTAITIGHTTSETTIQDNLTVTGDLKVSGATVTQNVDTVTIKDPIIALGTANDGAAPSSDDNKDRGLAMHYHTGSAAKIAFLGFDDNAGDLTFIPDATISSEVVSGTQGTINANLDGNVTGNITGTVLTATQGTIDHDSLANFAANEHFTQASITTVGTIGSGTWEGTTIAIDQGGTGATSAANAFAALKQAATTSATGVVELATDGEVEDGTGAGKVVDATQLGKRSVVADIDVSDSDFTSNLYAEINHSFETYDVVVQVYDITTELNVMCDIERKNKSGTASADYVTLKFASAPTNDLRVIITNNAGATAKTAVYA